MTTTENYKPSEAIAVIGVAGRYPGARTIEQFWHNLKEGRETISFYSDKQLLDAGLDPDLVNDPAFVKARPAYERPMEFDASFFGYTPREADIIDPQQRVFLECAWEALEDAGYDPIVFPGIIGLYGGSGMTSYLFGLVADPSVMRVRGPLSLVTSNDKDYLTTRVGYKLNLRGPCVTLQTACSTSLVGIIFACQSLLHHQTDIALAGGVTINPSEAGGYQFEEGGILSADGHNRSFDAAGSGTIFGSGAGVVVLRRVEDAIAAGDNIYAIIRGFGMNNDGSARIGFTAPGVEGQATVCRDALAMASIHPETIRYIECHGTATKRGDLVEITALTKAFRAFTEKKQFCAIGSVKANIGHMDAAAGIAGLTKALLVLKHGLVPPSLHFERPNPELDIENTPFFVNTCLSGLKGENGHPLRAAVSSFGVGGTNAHVILEEAPTIRPTSGSRPWQLVVWSARSAKTLEVMTANLTDHLERFPEESLADVAYTLQVGRRVFEYRRVLVCQTREDAITALKGREPGRLLTLSKDRGAKSVAFMFPGQGSQHVNMAKETYDHEPLFRSQIDLCAEILRPALPLDLQSILYPQDEDLQRSEREITKTQYAQPALFAVEYALAKLWEAWGIEPEAMVGHSVGEYVAACLSGVFSLKDALRLVAARGSMMQAMSPGSMLAVLIPEGELVDLIKPFPNLSLAAVNAPSACVVSGTLEDIDALERMLAQIHVPSRHLHTSHAFHSAMMEPMLKDFRALIQTVKLSPPRLRYLSNLTGTWITDGQATDPDYWVMHLRKTVRFSENLAAVLSDPSRLLLEVGPGRALGSLATQHPARRNDQSVLASLPHSKNDVFSDLQFLMTTAGRLWLEGKPLKWETYYANQQRRRISLPTYPFDHQGYVIEQAAKLPDQVQFSRRKTADISRWFHYQSWRRSVIWPQPEIPSADGTCLVFMDACGLGQQIVDRMRKASWDVLTICEGTYFAFDGSNSFVIRPGEQQDYNALLQELSSLKRTPTAVFHLWSVTSADMASGSELECYEQFLARGFMSLFHLAPAMSQQFSANTIRMAAITSDTYNVCDDEIPISVKAAIVGPCRSILAECPNIACRTIDIAFAETTKARNSSDLAEALIAEVFSEASEDIIAYRGGNRWLQAFEQIAVSCPATNPQLKPGGTYLITGGMGGIGLVLAEAIATIVPAKLALFSRSPFPPREEWEKLQHESGLTGEKVRRLLRIESLGSQVRVLNADVSNIREMTSVLAQVEDHFEKISGVIHSAGVAGTGIMLLKSKAQVMNVLLPKIEGTLVLEELFRHKKLDFFLLCSSLNSFVGEGGASDYIGANAFLDAFANSRRKSLNPPLAVQWDSWEDVGMVAWFDAPRKTTTTTIEHPFFASHVTDGREHTYVVQLNPKRHWMASEHILMGAPTLVGTAHLQFAYSAFTLAQGEGAVEIRDVLFFTPLTMKDESDRDVHVVLESGDDMWGFSIRSRSPNSEWQTHAMGKIGFAQNKSSTTHDLSAIRSRCQPSPLPKNRTTIYKGDIPFLQFGKRWENLQSWSFGENEGLACLCLPQQLSGDLEEYGLHPAIMDVATSFAIYRAGAANALYLPFAYNRIRINGMLPAKLYSYAHYEKGESFVSVNLVLFDEEGKQLVQIDGYEVHKVSEELLAAGDPKLIGNGRGGSRTLTPTIYKPKQAKPGARIHSSDGIEVLRRLLSLRHFAQIAVACRDLRAVKEEVKELFGSRGRQSNESEKKPENMHSRPALSAEYVAPRNDLERALVDIWQTMLGIRGIGVYDDFLELGGDSLLGIQVASRIRAEFEIELSIATFYKSPNIALLAESILDMLQGALTETELIEALGEIEAQASGQD